MTGDHRNSLCIKDNAAEDEFLWDVTKTKKVSLQKKAIVEVRDERDYKSLDRKMASKKKKKIHSCMCVRVSHDGTQVYFFVQRLYLWAFHLYYSKLI
jgi:hypothetical protein